MHAAIFMVLIGPFLPIRNITEAAKEGA